LTVIRSPVSSSTLTVDTAPNPTTKTSTV
jgi:hypothetical protein